MRYRNIIILLGFIVFILPALHFPQAWSNAFLMASGALVAVFGYLARGKRSPAPVPEAPAQSASVPSVPVEEVKA